MPANFEVRIKGVAICFFDSNAVWNVIFPCDPNHLVKFELNGVPTKTLREFKRAMQVDFPAASIPGPSAGQFGNVTIPFFNMSSDTYAHETNTASGARKSNLKKFDPKTKQNDLVWLKIPNATLSTDTASAQQYYVQDVTKNSGLPVTLIGNVAREFVIEFTANAPLSLTARDLRQTSHTTPVVAAPIPLPAAGSKQLLTFNNDCDPNCPEENDFLHLYDIVFDENPNPNKRRRFAAGQVKVLPAPGTPMMGASAIHGNCDPVVNDPPPGP